MPNAKTKPKKRPVPVEPTLDVRRLRAEILAGCLHLAEKTLTAKSKLSSLHLSCSQYFADEASDAVHETVIASELLLPPAPDPDAPTGVASKLRAKYLAWDSNGTEVYGFAPLCKEDRGSDDEDDGRLYEEAGPPPTPVLVVHRIDGTLRPHWLGTLHRPWLDFPGAMKDREDGFGATEFVTDPPMPTLQGNEKALYAQVLADPAELGAREVLRDAWLQRDDPRGEFSALSMQPSLADKLRARAAELVLEHGRSWLGPLQTVIPFSGSLFGDGPFLKKAIVYGDAKTLAKVGNAAQWATVEELGFANQSHRLVTRAMKNLRAVGPLNIKELAPLFEGTWRVRDLDVELDKRGTAPLAKLKLPLTHLRLRAGGAVDLKPLAKTPWWSSLKRIELWIPHDVDDGASAIVRAFDKLAPQLPAGCTLGVGQLAGGYRTGWLVAGTAKKRELELQHPDARFDQGTALSRILRTKLPTSWTPPNDDDWLTFGLGVSAEMKREA